MAVTAILVRRATRKHRGRFVALFLLVLVAALLLDIAILSGRQYAENTRERARALDTPDLALLIADRSAATQLADGLGRDDRVAQVTTTAVGWRTAQLRMGGGTTSTLVVYTDIDHAATLGRWRVLDQATPAITNGVYLPYRFEAGGDYRIGDSVTVGGPTGGTAYRIQGFVEYPMLGSVSLAAVGIGMHHDQFAAQLAAGGTSPGWLIQVGLADAADIQAVYTQANAQLASIDDAAGQQPSRVITLSLPDLVTTGTVSSSLYAALFTAFAMVIALVVWAVIRFLLRTTVVEELPGIGTLKAMGYTSGQVIRGFAAPYVAVASAAAVAGIGLSYAVLPVFAGSLAAQSGVPWQPRFSPLAAALTLLLLVGVVLVVSALSARRVRRIAPVDALRGGLATHNFRRNHLPLAASRGPVDLVLGVKALLQAIPRSLLVATVVGLVSFAGVFAAGLNRNAVQDPQAFRDLVIGEMEDVVVLLPRGDDGRAQLARIQDVPGVRTAAFVDYRNATVGDLTVQLKVADFAGLRNVGLYAGREPRDGEEVAVGGALAGALGKTIGDSIEVSTRGQTASYLITGLTQSARYTGRTVDMTSPGFDRIAPDTLPVSIAVYLDQPADSGAAVRRIEQAVGQQVAAVIDQRSSMDSQLSVFLTMIKILALIIVALTIVVLFLVIGLVIDTLIAAERRALGVRTALGFTSRDLTAQTLTAVLPAILAGAALGIAAGVVAMNPLLSLLLRGLGMVRVGFVVTPADVIVLGLGIVGCALLCLLVAARRLRRIQPTELLA